MPSAAAKIFSFILKLVWLKKIVDWLVRKPKRSNNRFAPQGLLRSLPHNIKKIDNRSVVTLEANSTTTKHIIYLHGGAYVMQIERPHWWFIKKLHQRLGCSVSVVDYPLAPEHNYKDTFRMMDKTYEYLIAQYPNDEFILMGDSAGGGLALAFAEKLAIENHPNQPVKNVLLSPWLDISMSNPSIKAVEHLDLMLNTNSLIEAGKHYADVDDPSHYLLSPINGDTEELGNTLLVIGTSDILYPDCLLLQQKMKDNLVMLAYPDMQHVWFLFPMPESKQVFEEITLFLEE